MRVSTPTILAPELSSQPFDLARDSFFPTLLLRLIFTLIPPRLHTPLIIILSSNFARLLVRHSPKNKFTKQSKRYPKYKSRFNTETQFSIQLHNFYKLNIYCNYKDHTHKDVTAPSEKKIIQSALFALQRGKNEGEKNN